MEKQAERRSSVEEDETVKLLVELRKKLQAEPPRYALRVKAGSYTVTNYYEQDSDPAGPSDGDDSRPRRARQKIPTVKTESPLFKLRDLLCRCVRGNFRRRQEEVVVMDQVNLAIEPGKMYLVL